MSDREKAIDHFNRTIAQLKYLDGREDSPCLKYYIRVRNAKSRRRLLASRVALAALRAEEEREKGCGVVYRHRVLGGYKYVTCPTCKTEIKTEQPCVGDYPYCGDCGKVILDAEQPFCGWCGRKLDGGGQDG